MAQIEDRKSNFYSRKQSVRDEALAPQHLESAGDFLIKSLARKQTDTKTTLEEQLKVKQNFEKGFKLDPDHRKGITSLEDFRKQSVDDIKSGKFSENVAKTQNLEEFKKITGLSRHELELNFSEKPNSLTSKLYKFAAGNQKFKFQKESLKMLIPDHPINHLKEIEKECFGHLVGTQEGFINSQSFNEGIQKEVKRKKSRKKQHRTRKKKRCGDIIDIDEETCTTSKNAKQPEVWTKCDSVTEIKGNLNPVARPSLWDVKDMKKWCEGKQYGCATQTLYTIKDGKIVKLENGFKSEDVT